MNYQKMCNTLINYQLDQNKAFNYQRQPFFHFHQLEVLKETVNGSCAVLHGGMLEECGSSWGENRKMVVVHGGKDEENEGKTACDGHVPC
jgi:hypothetical protein